MQGLKDKVVLVTGAGGKHGIGRAIALRFAQEGANVVVSDLTSNARGDWAGLPAVVDEIETMGRQALAFEADVSSADQVKQMVQTALAQFGRIDILVNNAGSPVGPDRVPVVDLEETVFDLVQRVNVKGTFLCARAVAQHLIVRGEGGNIINIASTAGLIGVARHAAYCSSKFAVIGFTQCLAHELGPQGIQVNAICPGLIETERLDGIAAGLRPEGVTTEEFRASMVKESVQATPLGRIGQPRDIANMAVFLASPEGDYITGQALSVSGGGVMLR